MVTEGYLYLDKHALIGATAEVIRLKGDKVSPGGRVSFHKMSFTAHTFRVKQRFVRSTKKNKDLL